MDANITKIRDGLERLRAAQPKVFGASAHEFKLNPPLTTKQVGHFEKKHRIELPEEYRLFLTELGNGGAGPHYGVFKLGEMDDNFDMMRWKESKGLIGVLSKPFPHSKRWNEVPEEPDSSLPPEQYDAACEAVDDIYWNSKHVNGAVPICHHGCAYRDWLVVTGAEAGNVWHDARADQAGLMPYGKGRRKRLTFFGWYMEWLKESLASLP